MPGPLWMGIRLNTFKNSYAYQRLVYPKGGFVLHMLRYLMFDRETGDKDFIAMMHDFVATYTNQNASTESFKSIVEKHMKPSLDLERNGKMDWFFREWVYGTEMPSYRMEYSLAPEDDGKYMFTAKVTQSGVSPSFAMGVPIYFDFDGHVMRAGSGRNARQYDLQRNEAPAAQEAQACPAECQSRRTGGGNCCQGDVRRCSREDNSSDWPLHPPALAAAESDRSFRSFDYSQVRTAPDSPLRRQFDTNHASSCS